MTGSPVADAIRWNSAPSNPVRTGAQRILIVGGGISGITAAVEASEAGAEIVLVERNAYLGGRVAQLYEYFPKLCPPTCGLEINLRRIRSSPRVRCLTLAEVETLAFSSGVWQAKIRQEPRFVNSRCTACGACAQSCPVEAPDPFNFNINKRRAIGLPHANAWPLAYTIDAQACLGPSCGKCVAACGYGAIDLSMAPRPLELEADAVIWTTGWDPYDAGALEGLGFGAHPDIITNMMLERLASPGGPTQGRIVRPSSGEAPSSIVFVQCAGSRDDNHLKHCSGVCCMATAKQARYIWAQHPEARITVFYIDLRAPGRQELFLMETQKDPRIRFLRGKAAHLSPTADGSAIRVEAEDVTTEQRLVLEASMVVLATGMAPAAPGPLLSGLHRDEHGFLAKDQPWPGLFPAGCARTPTSVEAAVRDATRAALRAIQRSAGRGAP